MITFHRNAKLNFKPGWVRSTMLSDEGVVAEHWFQDLFKCSAAQEDGNMYMCDSVSKQAEWLET
eukprot:10874969-Lingulodinium_polyedra.AAC.1